MSSSKYLAGSAKPSGGSQFEVYQWYYFRVSGLLLVFLAFFHLWLNHVQTEVGTLSYELVTSRLRAFPILKVADFLLLALGLSHGVLGIKNLIDDHVHQAGRRALWLTALIVLFSVFLIAGTAVLWTLEV